MRIPRFRWPISVYLSAILLATIGGLVLIPSWLFPSLSDSALNAVPSIEKRIELQQSQAQLQNNARTVVLQAVAGLLVVVGATVTLRQVQASREGHTTERFTKAIDQIGSDNLDVRLGGIYALERVARNSPADRPQIQYLLGGYLRNHSPWPPREAPEDFEHPTPQVDEVQWLYVRATDVQVVMDVLGRRLRAPDERPLYLSRVDLRSANLNRADLSGAIIRHANLSRAWLGGAVLDGANLENSDLRQARAPGASFRRANLTRAHLQGAELRDADLREAILSGADLRGTDLRGTRLDGATVTDVLTDELTRWPDDHDRQTE